MWRAASGRLIAGSSRHRTTSDTSPIGTLTKKIQCQLKRVGDEAAEARTDQRRDAEDGPEEAQVLAALGRRVQVGDDRERDREDGAAAEALEAAEQDELPHLLAEAGQDRRDEEQADREDDDRPPAEQVGQLAVDRPADRGGQQVDRDRPRVEAVAVQVGDDPAAGPCRRRSGRGRTGTARAGSRRGSRASLAGRG